MKDTSTTTTASPTGNAGTITKMDRDLGRELGLQAGVVSRLRTQAEGEGAKDVAGRVRELAGVGAASDSPSRVAPVPAPDTEPVAEEFLLKVLRRCVNPTWVVCQSPAPEAKAVNVRVRKNLKLRPGMLLRCCKTTNGNGNSDASEWRCVHQGFAPLGQ